eukprot:1154935-Pelagomonas_calceolata.AAC.1
MLVLPCQETSGQRHLRIPAKLLQKKLLVASMGEHVLGKGQEQICLQLYQGAGILKHSHNEYVWYAQGGGELVSILPPAFRKTAFPQKHPQRKYMFYAHVVAAQFALLESRKQYAKEQVPQWKEDVHLSLKLGWKSGPCLLLDRAHGNCLAVFPSVIKCKRA